MQRIFHSSEARSFVRFQLHFIRSGYWRPSPEIVASSAECPKLIGFYYWGHGVFFPTILPQPLHSSPLHLSRMLFAFGSFYFPYFPPTFSLLPVKICFLRKLIFFSSYLSSSLSTTAPHGKLLIKSQRSDREGTEPSQICSFFSHAIKLNSECFDDKTIHLNWKALTFWPMSFNLKLMQLSMNSHNLWGCPNKSVMENFVGDIIPSCWETVSLYLFSKLIKTVSLYLFNKLIKTVSLYLFIKNLT